MMADLTIHIKNIPQEFIDAAIEGVNEIAVGRGLVLGVPTEINIDYPALVRERDEDVNNLVGTVIGLYAVSEASKHKK